GGIFEHLPVSQIKGSFERYFATPQDVQLDILCQAYGVEHQRVKNWGALIDAIKVLPKQGVRLLEVPTNRKADQAQLQEFLGLSLS
ncbi:MAG: 2-succinyl-5-enolpyruvyl-6-hydroxy-3-cyclohexene-1-carboxylate synthase, partial [Lentimonas sp.]